MNIVTGIAPDGWERHVMQAGYTPMTCGVCRRTIWIGHGRTLEACDSVKALERHDLYGVWPLLYEDGMLVDVGLPSENGWDAHRLWFVTHMHTDVIAATTADLHDITPTTLLDPAMLNVPVHYERCIDCGTTILWDDMSIRAYDAQPLRGADVQPGMRVAKLCGTFKRTTLRLQYLDIDRRRVTPRGLYYRLHTRSEV